MWFPVVFYSWEKKKLLKDVKKKKNLLDAEIEETETYEILGNFGLIFISLKSLSFTVFFPPMSELKYPASKPLQTHKEKVLVCYNFVANLIE